MRRAGISAEQIDYINAHGTSTPLGDEIELKAVERLVGNAAGRIAMSSTKSSIGHSLGAAGAVEAIFCLLAMRDQVVPPTINLDNPSVATAIDLVPHRARKRPVNIALSNSFGFGGTNASLILRRMTHKCQSPFRHICSALGCNPQVRVPLIVSLGSAVECASIRCEKGLSVVNHFTKQDIRR